MSEPVQLAKAARVKLAAALNALQADDDVPSELLEAAEPIAQAMSVLHRIERTDGANLEGRDTALASVRTALDQLQKISASHAAVDTVMEHVAGSLSKVHALARYQPPAAPVVQPAPQPAPQPVARPAPQPVAQPAPQPVAQPAPQPVAQPAPQPVAQPVHVPAEHKMTLPLTPGPSPTPVYQPPAQPAPIAPAPVVQPAPSFQAEIPPAPAFQPVAQPAQPSYQGQPAYQAPLQPVRQVPQERPSQPRTSMPAVDVELGIHSTSNFYKGLGGNDVIEHGGLFVATYKALQIGTPVSLHVHLPGDYEFRASGVVQWTREAGTSEPGFGVRLTQITPEGRQLVYRYTRNREPMFYDDL